MEELTKEETNKLKTLCEFLFDDIYHYWATYERFEICFQPLFHNVEINLYKAFVDIIGEKKKYLTYPRFMSAYLKYKYNNEYIRQNNHDLYIFFKNILGIILKNVNSYIGKHEEYSKASQNKVISFSTKRGGRNQEESLNESFISKIQVLKDINEKIRGIILEFDDINKYELYPKEIIDDLFFGLEINLGIIQKKYFIQNKKINNENFNMSLYRDSITHIFGTFDKTNNLMTYLGFKCVSGKIRFIGMPSGEPFLFGEFGKKFYNLRIEINEEKGITLFEPGFLKNERKNYCLKNFDNKIDNAGLEVNLFEEKLLIDADEDRLNQLITTTIIERRDDSIKDKDDKIPGNDYKEVVELTNREWIINKEKKEISLNSLNISDELKIDKKSISANSVVKDSHIKLNQDLNEIFSYNPSQIPFFPRVKNPKYNKPYNPFFQKSEIVLNILENQSFIHTMVAVQPNRKKLEMIIENEIINKIKKKSKLREIFKKTSFKHLMEKLSKEIYDEFYKEYKNDRLIPFSILNEIIPNEIDEREKRIKKKTITKKRKFMINGEIIELTDLNTNENNQIMNVDEEKEENVINSDALEFKNKIKYDIEKYKKVNDKSNDEYWTKKWQTLFNPLRKRYASILFPKIGKIIVTMIKVFKDNNKKIELKDKIEYYNILSDKHNEKIINFLTQCEIDDEDKKEKKEEEIEDSIFDLGLELSKSNSSYLEDMENSIKSLKTQIFKEKGNTKKLKKMKKKLGDLIKEKNTHIENITNQEKEVLKESIMDDEVLRGNLFGELRRRNSWELAGETQLLSSTIISFDDEFNDEGLNDDENNFISNFHRQGQNIRDQDPEFIPNENSLCPNMKDSKKLPEKVLSSDVENWESINWKKYNRVKIFSKNKLPQLDNIRQGEYIGDCYFLSALGSLCEKGDYLKNMIEEIKLDNKLILYKVRLNINGKWKYVLLDNFFPNVSKNGKEMFCFGSSFKRELWVSLFEKAWAKINGCYARIGTGGYCREAYDILTEGYTEFLLIQGLDNEGRIKLWEKLIKSNENNYVICAGTRHLGFWDGLGIFIGLISSHAYTIIKIYDKKYQGKHYQLVKLRNPWGEKEFNGDWSDKSSKWTEDLKKLFEFDADKDDGIFYMSYDDFLKYYKNLEILKIKENYGIRATCKIKKTEAYKCQMIEFVIKQNREKKEMNKKVITFINLYQKNPRIIMKNGEYPPKPVKSFIILAKKNAKGEYIYIKSVSGTNVHIAIEAELEIGTTYIIFSDVNYRFVYDKIYGYNITFYSDNSKEFEVKNITNEKNGIERAEILEQILINYSLNNLDNFERKNKENNKIDLFKLKNFSEIFPFIILFIKYKEEIQSKNYKIYFSLELNNKTKGKEMCIYNDSEASEFDYHFCRQMKKKNSIVLLMGYTISDIFSLSYGFFNKKKEFDHKVFNGECFYNDGNLKRFRNSSYDNKGFILGLENIRNKTLNMNITFQGFNIINPEYDNTEDGEVRNINMKTGEKKVFNLRFKPGFGDYGYQIKYKN